MDAKFSDLLGLTLKKIDTSADEVLFETVNGNIFRLYHSYTCCESVTLEDVCGDLEDLVGTPILRAEEVTELGAESGVSCTWTFYKLSTIRGAVTLRWYGTSSGDYSEKVDFERVLKK